MKNLTDREIQVAELVVLGYSNKEIAEKLFISIHTVKAILEHIYEKLNLNNRVLLAVYITKQLYSQVNQKELAPD